MNELQLCVANQNYFQLENALQFIFIAEINDGRNGANSVSTFFINGKSAFSNVPRRLPIILSS